MPKRVMPKKLVTLDFSDDGYEGFTCGTWVDPPIAFVRRMNDWALEQNRKEGERKRKKRKVADYSEEFANESTVMFLHIFPSWDFADYEGNPIPHSEKGIDLIQEGLATAMWRRRVEAIRNGVMPAPLEGNSSSGPSEDEKG